MYCYGKQGSTFDFFLSREPNHNSVARDAHAQNHTTTRQMVQRQRMHPLKSFYWITLGNARCLSLEDKIGTLDAGTEADVVVLNSRATSAMALRMETVTSLSEELFVLQTLGDDRAVAQTYVAGEAIAL